MAMYQRFCEETQSYRSILLHPSQEVKPGLLAALASTEFPTNLQMFFIPFTVLAIAGHDWRDYINHLENCVYNIVHESEKV